MLEQSGVRWLIILEGVNDIGQSFGPGVGEDLIDAYRQMIQYAHLQGIFVYGATLLPFGESSYYSEQHEAERQIVNEWIRTTDLLDGVIDLDRALRNPADTLRLLPEADDGDRLHPSEVGHRLMAEAVDLELFVGREPLEYTDESVTLYYEPECATVGERWEIVRDDQASHGSYVTVEAGTQSLMEAPTGQEHVITLPFAVDSTGTYTVFARLNNPTFDDDSFWVRMDDGAFEMHNGLVTSGWAWMTFGDYDLTAGAHTLTVAYREDGARLDKIGISNALFSPIGMGKPVYHNGYRRAGARPRWVRVRAELPEPFSSNHRHRVLRAPAKRRHPGGL